MSIFADGYSRYLSNHFNYINKYKEFRKYFKNLIISLTDPKFMSKQLIINKDNFPKYPYFLNAFIRTDYIDLVKIYNSSLDNTENLVESLVGAEELAKKELYDTIPSSLDSFLAEIYFQFAYTSTVDDLYNYNSIMRSFITEYQYRNFFSDLYVPLFYSTDQIEGQTAGLEDYSFLCQYVLYSSLYNVTSSLHTVYPNILRYVTYINNYGAAADRVDQATMLSDFQTFVTTYSTDMSIDLSSIIGKSIYDFQKMSPVMVQNLITTISSKINNVTSGLYDSFYDFYFPLTSLAPINFLANNTVQQLNGLTSVDIVSKIYKDFTIIDETLTTTQLEFENSNYESYMGAINEYNLKNYLFLSFLYKFWPEKFLNVLQLSLKEFIENSIKTPADNSMDQGDFGSLYSQIVDNINYTNLESYLNSKLLPTASLITGSLGALAEFTFAPGTPYIVCSNLDSFNAVSTHDYIYADGDSRQYSAHIISKDLGTLTLTADDDYAGSISTVDVNAYGYNLSSNYLNDITLSAQVGEFAAYMYYIYLFDEYFKSTQYTTFVEELTELIFTYLRDTGHIDYTFDWYKYHDVIDVYLKAYLRWKLLDQSKRTVLSNFSNAAYRFISGSTFIYCSNLESYNLITNGDFIFSEQDSVDNAVEVISHSIVGGMYILNTGSIYTGHSTASNLYEIAYYYAPANKLLFDTVTQNFSNKLLPNVMANATANPIYDFNIVVPNSTDLYNFFKSVSTSPSIIRSMHQFSENLMLSTVTRETIYSVLSDFIK